MKFIGQIIKAGPGQIGSAALAFRTGLSQRQIRYMARAGSIPRRRPGNGWMVFEESPELEAWITGHTVSRPAQGRRGRKPKEAYKALDLSRAVNRGKTVFADCHSQESFIMRLGELCAYAGTVLGRWSQVPAGRRKRLNAAVKPLWNAHQKIVKSKGESRKRRREGPRQRRG